MEQNFQTSFMPKKPMIEERARVSQPIGLFSVLAIFIFFTVLLVTGGVYFYQNVMNKNIADMKVNLEKAKNRFEPTKIVQLQTLDKRLKASTEVLNKHIAISPIFQLLQSVTEKTVRYTKFSYDLGTGGTSKVVFKLEGKALGYKAIALQSDLFTQNKQMIDPVFSNLLLDDKGNVNFQLDFSVDPSLVDYNQMLKVESSDAANGASPQQTPIN